MRSSDRFALTIGLVASLLAVGQAGAAAPSPAKAEAAIIAAGRAQHSVHYVATITQPGIKVTELADVAGDRGVQRVSVVAGTRTGEVTVLVVGGAVYVRGNPFALRYLQGMTAAEAQADAGVWVRIPSYSQLYVPTKTDVTLPSVIGDLGLKPPVAKLRATVVSGQKAIGVSGVAVESQAPAKLYAGSGRLPLPIEEVSRSPDGTATILLSRWNERVKIAVPKNARTLTAPAITA